jgi:DNA-binding beta-propeller fold protein YncE
VDVIDGNKNVVQARIPVFSYPEGMTFNTATGRLYVANEGDDEGGHIHDSGNSITVIDGKTLNVLGTLPVGKAPDGVEADPVLHLVYVAVEDSNAVVEVSDSTNLPLQASTKLDQVIAARNAITLLQQAAIVTLIVMLLTIAWTTLAALSPRWRVRESPQTPQGDASSRSEVHSLPR